jgi:hypothetical protein
LKSSDQVQGLHIIQYIFRFLINLVVRQMAVFDRRADICMPKNVGRLAKGHAGLNQSAYLNGLENE